MVRPKGEKHRKTEQNTFDTSPKDFTVTKVPERNDRKNQLRKVFEKIVTVDFPPLMS